MNNIFNVFVANINLGLRCRLKFCTVAKFPHRSAQFVIIYNFLNSIPFCINSQQRKVICGLLQTGDKIFYKRNSLLYQHIVQGFGAWWLISKPAMECIWRKTLNLRCVFILITLRLCLSAFIARLRCQIYNLIRSTGVQSKFRNYIS